jgi:hypothetical protein
MWTILADFSTHLDVRQAMPELPPSFHNWWQAWSLYAQFGLKAVAAISLTILFQNLKTVLARPMKSLRSE